MILGMVFSKDRALQLDACLSSFARQVTDAGSVRVVVLYAASSPRYLRQYQELASEHPPRVEFLLESEFRHQLLTTLLEASPGGAAVRRDSLWRRVLRPATEQDLAGDGVLFLVDDALFIRPFALASAQDALRAHPRALGFSLRLGRNTTQSYVLSRPQRLPPFQQASPGMLLFDWTNADADFGYPLEISSSVYRLPTMIGIIGKLRFSDPNTLESQLALNAKRLIRTHPLLLCSEQSVAFSAPLNRVQDVYTNRSSESPEWAAEKLADKFDDGYRLDTRALDAFVPAACHQEIEPTFVTRKRPDAGE